MRFTIRELVLVTVIVAVSVAWFIDHRLQATQARKWHDELTVNRYNWEVCKVAILDLQKLEPRLRWVEKEMETLQTSNQSNSK